MGFLYTTRSQRALKLCCREHTHEPCKVAKTFPHVVCAEVSKMVRAITIYSSPKSVKKRSTTTMMEMRAHPDSQQCFRSRECEWMFTAHQQLPLESFSQNSSTSIYEDANGNLMTNNPEITCISFVPPPTPTITRSSSSSSSHAEKKRVRFVEPETTSTISIHWNLQDMRNSWYQVEDYEYFENDTRLTVLALRHVRGDLRKLDPGQYTVAGLEKNLSRKQMYHRKLQTVRHVQTIIDAQLTGDEEQLKAISEMFSKQTIQRAHLRATLDQSLLQC